MNRSCCLQNRRAPSRSDGRTSRRHRKRWKIERTFAWLGNSRRPAARHDYNIKPCEAFFPFARLIITLRHL